MPRPALGLIETRGLTGAIQATHAATKAGEIAIASAERTDAGCITVKIEGDWEAVQAAVEAGARAADKAGELLSMHVIPRTDNGINPILPYRRFIDRYRPGQRPTKSEAGKKPRLHALRPEKSEHAAVEAKGALPSLPPPSHSKPVEKPEPKPPLEGPGETTGQPLDREMSLDRLKVMPVTKLRKYARTVQGLPIQGRQISMANKQQLLDAIVSVIHVRPD